MLNADSAATVLASQLTCVGLSYFCVEKPLAAQDLGNSPAASPKPETRPAVSASVSSCFGMCAAAAPNVSSGWPPFPWAYPSTNRAQQDVHNTVAAAEFRSDTVRLPDLGCPRCAWMPRVSRSSRAHQADLIQDHRPSFAWC